MADGGTLKSLLVADIRDVEKMYGIANGNTITVKESVESVQVFRQRAAKASGPDSLQQVAFHTMSIDSLLYFYGDSVMSFTQFQGIFSLVNRVLVQLQQKQLSGVSALQKAKIVYQFLVRMEQKNISCLKSLPYRILRVIVLLIVDQKYYYASIFANLLIHQAVLEVHHESARGSAGKG